MPHANSASGCLSALWSSLRSLRLRGLIRLRLRNSKSEIRNSSAFDLLSSIFYPRISVFPFLLLLLWSTALAQDQASPTAKQPTPVPEQGLATYVLGPGDTLTIRALNVEEISEKPVRIGTSGI